MTDNNIKEKVKNAAYNTIKKLIFEYGGIIYGGMVRDEYISEYYKNKFNENKFDKKMFWNTTFHPETAYRTLLAEDIDVSFTNLEKADAFINNLIIKDEFKKSKINTYLPPPYMPHIKLMKRLKIAIIIGYIPFICKGETMYINIDIVIPVKEGLTPPFKNIDLLCNAFIMTKEGKKLSNNTGTIIDKYSEYDRTVISAKIIKDMLGFKTCICVNPVFYNRIYYIDFNNNCMKLIQKMHSKKFPWTITNMPFENYIAYDINDSTCCICCDDITKGERICNTSYSSHKSPPSHYECMIKYLFSQINNEHKLYNLYQRSDVERFLIANKNSFIFKCPYRNIINFAKCRNVIVEIYKE